MNSENKTDEVEAEPRAEAASLEDPAPSGAPSAPPTPAQTDAPPETSPETSPETPRELQQDSAAEPSPAESSPEPLAAADAPPREAAPASAPGAAGEDPATATLRRHGHVAPAHIPLERIDEDTSLRIRPEGDLSALATDLARLGQLYPVDVRFKPPDRFQLISGFRRVAALRFLKRDRVLARLHTDLSDEDALLLALASAIHASPVSPEELSERRERLEAEGRLTPIARDMLDKALATEDSLASETVEEEVDADELAQEATQRLVEINQDLALLADVFADLDEARKQELVTQLRYSADLVAWLERL